MPRGNFVINFTRKPFTPTRPINDRTLICLVAPFKDDSFRFKVYRNINDALIEQETTIPEAVGYRYLQILSQFRWVNEIVLVNVTRRVEKDTRPILTMNVNRTPEDAEIQEEIRWEGQLLTLSGDFVPDVLLHVYSHDNFEKIHTDDEGRFVYNKTHKHQGRYVINFTWVGTEYYQDGHYDESYTVTDPDPSRKRTIFRRMDIPSSVKVGEEYTISGALEYQDGEIAVGVDNVELNYEIRTASHEVVYKKKIITDSAGEFTCTSFINLYEEYSESEVPARVILDYAGDDDFHPVILEQHIHIQRLVNESMKDYSRLGQTHQKVLLESMEEVMDYEMNDTTFSEVCELIKDARFNILSMPYQLNNQQKKEYMETFKYKDNAMHGYGAFIQYAPTLFDQEEDNTDIQVYVKDFEEGGVYGIITTPLTLKDGTEYSLEETTVYMSGWLAGIEENDRVSMRIMDDISDGVGVIEYGKIIYDKFVNNSMWTTRHLDKIRNIIVVANANTPNNNDVLTERVYHRVLNELRTELEKYQGKENSLEISLPQMITTLVMLERKFRDEEKYITALRYDISVKNTTGLIVKIQVEQVNVIHTIFVEGDLIVE